MHGYKTKKYVLKEFGKFEWLQSRGYTLIEWFLFSSIHWIEKFIRIHKLLKQVKNNSKFLFTLKQNDGNNKPFWMSWSTLWKLKECCMLSIIIFCLFLFSFASKNSQNSYYHNCLSPKNKIFRVKKVKLGMIWIII